MKIYHQLSWAGFGLAVILIILGIIDHLMGGLYFGLKHSSTFITLANTALIGGVFFKLMAPKG